MRRFGHIALVWTICSELAFGAPVASAAPPPTAPPARLGDRPSPATDPLAHAFEEPIVDYLRGLSEIELHVDLAPDDPALDADPFFLRSQRWVAPRPTDSAGYATDASGFTLFLPRETHGWRLEVPLRPLGFAGDYLWCAARDTSFFPPLTSEDHGEGLFVVNLREWHRAERAGRPVPVFFLPLPDGGWSGPTVTLSDFPADDAAIVVDAEGMAQPIRLEDVDAAVEAETLNLTLARGTAARDAAHGHSTPSALPSPKSTASFGTLFTGFGADGAPRIFAAGPPRGPRRIFHALREALGIPLARAGALEGAPGVSDKLTRSLTRVAAVVAVSTLAAIVLKYTLYRRHFRDRRKEPQRTLFRRLRGEASEIGTVLAHNLTLISSFPAVWFGHGVQYVVDRYVPALGAGRNKRLFRLLDATVYFMRNARKRLPVNDDTLVRGALVLGGVASLVTAARLYYVVPWLAEAYAAATPAAREKVADIFHPDNEHAESFARNETVRTFGTNLAGGASTLSEATRQQYVSVFGPAVDEELRKEGLDPLDEENHPLREARVEEKLRHVLAQMGLPVDDELFNSTTLWSGALALLGYGPPETETSAPRYLAAERPGLVQAALAEARREIARRLERTPHQVDLRNALVLLEETQSNAAKLRGLARTGLRAVTATLRKPLRSVLTGFRPAREAIAEGAARLRKIRQQLFALTQDGPLGRVAPSSEWIEAAGRPGASIAAHFFRRAFFGYLAGDAAYVHGPSEEDRARLSRGTHAAAEAAARRRLAERYADDVPAFLGDAHATEYTLLLEDELNDAVAARREDHRPFLPPKRGFYRRRQERAAAREALVRFERETKRTFDPATADRRDQARFRRYFTEAAMANIGLHPSYEGLEELEQPILEATEQRTRRQLWSPKLVEWLEGLPPEERATFEASTYAENFAAIYVETTTGSVEAIARKRYQAGHPEGKAWDPATATATEHRWWKHVYEKTALAPGQPGRFQKFRQRRWVRRSRFVTRLARAAESLFPAEATAFGGWNRIYRNVPGLYDGVVATGLTFRRSITAAFALYPAAYVLFGVTMPLHLWLLSQAFFFTTAGPYMTLTRFYRYQGYRPMASYAGLAGFALLGGLATMWGTFPMLLLAEDTKRLVEQALPCAARLVGS